MPLDGGMYYFFHAYSISAQKFMALMSMLCQFKMDLLCSECSPSHAGPCLSQEERDDVIHAGPLLSGRENIYQNPLQYIPLMSFQLELDCLAIPYCREGQKDGEQDFHDELRPNKTFLLELYVLGPQIKPKKTAG